MEIFDIKNETNKLLDRIDALRVERGFSIYRLSQEAGISHNTLKFMFNKKSSPNFETLLHICEAFQISMCELFAYTLDEQDMESEINLNILMKTISPDSQIALLHIIKQLK